MRWQGYSHNKSITKWVPQQRWGWGSYRQIALIAVHLLCARTNSNTSATRCKIRQRSTLSYPKCHNLPFVCKIAIPHSKQPSMEFTNSNNRNQSGQKHNQHIKETECLWGVRHTWHQHHQQCQQPCQLRDQPSHKTSLMTDVHNHQTHSRALTLGWFQYW